MISAPVVELNMGPNAVAVFVSCRRVSSAILEIIKQAIVAKRFYVYWFVNFSAFNRST